MAQHLHHINFLVRDLNKAISAFEQLFLTSPIIEPLPLRQAITARFKVDKTWFVLVSPTEDSGVIADLLERRGEGVFLVSFGAESISRALSEHTNLEVEGTPRSGLSNWLVQDVKASYDFNAIFQFCEEK